MSATNNFQEKLGITSQEFNEIGKIGAMYLEQGNFQKARTIFEGLIELNPNDAIAYSALGALYTILEEDYEALKYLTKAIELNSGLIAAYVNRAEVFIRQQKLVEAVADLKTAIELDPTRKDSGANRARAMVLGIYDTFQIKGFIPMPTEK